jgi:hypothetical protein
MHLKAGAGHITDMVKAQKANEKMKSSEKTTYTKSNHFQLPRATGGPFFLPRTPRTFGGGPWSLALLVAGAGFVASALSVVVASLGAASSMAAEESTAPEKAVAPPLASPPAAGIAAEVMEL